MQTLGCIQVVPGSSYLFRKANNIPTKSGQVYSKLKTTLIIADDENATWFIFNGEMESLIYFSSLAIIAVCARARQLNLQLSVCFTKLRHIFSKFWGKEPAKRSSKLRAVNAA